jgi:integrase
MTGHVQRRGKRSWRIKFDVGTDMDGKRKTHFRTFRGTKRDAEVELARLVTEAQQGVLVDPSRTTTSEFLDRWERDWAVPNASPKTVERWSELLRLHVRPYVGHVAIQRLEKAHLSELYARLLREGRGETGLSARTVGHVHRVLHGALRQAVEWKIVNSNTATGVKLPKVEDKEMKVLSTGEIQKTLNHLRRANYPDGRYLYPLIALAVTTGMRRGEILGLRWMSVDLAKGLVRVDCTLEQTKQGLRLKPPKTKTGRRTITLPGFVVALLRDHWKAQQETRLALGIGKSPEDSLVFAAADGQPRVPGYVTKAWMEVSRTLGLNARFHDLRHTHASQLIASGMDIVTIQRRLGHSKPSTTLNVYGHLWGSGDTQAAQTMEAAFSPRTD